jgi:hypothetical protein
MSREEFRDLFRNALVAANGPLSSCDQIELHHFGIRDCSFPEACERLYLGADSFFKVIDVAAHPKRDGWCFVRPSGHEPGPWNETRFPETTGPFNVMTPQ